MWLDVRGRVPLDGEHPRAHITNQRAMEFFRAMEIENQVLAEAAPHGMMGDTVLCTSPGQGGDRADFLLGRA